MRSLGRDGLYISAATACPHRPCRRFGTGYGPSFVIGTELPEDHTNWLRRRLANLSICDSNG